MISLNFKNKGGSLSTAFRGAKSGAGFTLIEMMVAISIFTIVVTVALGSLLSIINANRKSKSVQSLMTNLNFVIDDISRGARVGSGYSCANGLGGVGSPSNCSDKIYFGFDPTGGGDRVIYRYNSGNMAIDKSVDGGSTFVQITSPEIVVDRFRFWVDGVGSSSQGEQPKMIVVLMGTAGTDPKISTDFSIQTSVTQRILDL